jgi:flavodoxin
MKTLVVYYSRTGTTKKVGQEIAKQLKADSEEILDVKSRLGPIGWLRSGREGKGKKLAEIKPIKKDPSKYDLVLIGTPNWAANMSSPVRTYLSKHKFKKTAYFLTGGGNPGIAFEDMEALAGKPIATLVVLSKEVAQNAYSGKVKEFTASLK